MLRKAQRCTHVLRRCVPHDGVNRPFAKPNNGLVRSTRLLRVQLRSPRTAVVRSRWRGFSSQRDPLQVNEERSVTKEEAARKLPWMRSFAPALSSILAFPGSIYRQLRDAITSARAPPEGTTTTISEAEEQLHSSTSRLERDMEVDIRAKTSADAATLEKVLTQSRTEEELKGCDAATLEKVLPQSRTEEELKGGDAAILERILTGVRTKEELKDTITDASRDPGTPRDAAGSTATATSRYQASVKVISEYAAGLSARTEASLGTVYVESSMRVLLQYIPGFSQLEHAFKCAVLQVFELAVRVILLQSDHEVQAKVAAQLSTILVKHALDPLGASLALIQFLVEHQTVFDVKEQRIVSGLVPHLRAVISAVTLVIGFTRKKK